MKKLLVLVAAFGLLYSCSGKKSVENVENAISAADSLVTAVINEHNAKNSLDYQGTYTGELPAADAQGIKVSITLTDSTFAKTAEYVGKKGVFENKGSYTWNADGNTITLQGVDAPNQYFVGENTLTQLDIEGNKIAGDLAEKYILKK